MYGKSRERVWGLLKGGSSKVYQKYTAYLEVEFKLAQNSSKVLNFVELLRVLRGYKKRVLLVLLGTKKGNCILFSQKPTHITCPNQ
jgi:hypothetical protein